MSDNYRDIKRMRLAADGMGRIFDPIYRDVRPCPRVAKIINAINKGRINNEIR